MQLVLDAGNSSIKIALFDNDKIIKTCNVNYDIDAIQMVLAQFSSDKIQKIGYCSVVDFDLQKILSEKWSNVTQINSTSNFHFEIKYKTPKTLGIDRLVACAGARVIQPKDNILVIDIGTCITYDFVTKNNEYIGGAISPGLKLRTKSMHNFTSKLPLVELKKEELNIDGNSTKNALISGVLKGTLFELIGFINEKKKSSKNLTVFLTGGDAFFFEDALKNDIFAQKNLILIGLNELLKINA